MKLIPLFLLAGMLAVSGWAERYSAELVEKAEAGDANAQCILGWCYKNGQGVGKDEKEAVKWYTKSAEQGNAAAQYNLGVSYKEGTGVGKDAKEAVKWFTKLTNLTPKKKDHWTIISLGWEVWKQVNLQKLNKRFFWQVTITGPRLRMSGRNTCV